MNKVNQTTYALLLKALMDDPHTPHELAALTGVHLQTARSLMHTFRRHRVVHISAWEKDRLGRVCTPVYAFGTGIDKPKRALTGAQRQARVRERRRLAPLGVIV